MSVAVAHTPRTKKWSAKEACIVGGKLVYGRSTLRATLAGRARERSPINVRKPLAREEGVLNETSTHVAHAA